MTTQRSGFVLLALFCCFHGVARASGPTPPTLATRTFLEAHPGARAMIGGERLIALYGIPLAIDSDPGTNTDQFVDAFLSQHADALGVDDLVLALKGEITIRGGKFTVYTYAQRIEGLHVHASVVKIPVLLGETETISYVGMHLVQTPASPLPPARHRSPTCRPARTTPLQWLGW